MCLEAALNINDIKSDKQRFNTVIVALGNCAKHLYSVIGKYNQSESCDRYQTLKTTVLDFFRPSENQRLTKLLSGIPLGDRKPSVLLAEMRRMGGDKCPDSITANIWMRALPNTVRSIIASMSSATLDDQAKVADKIMESPQTEVHAIQERHTAPSWEERFDELTRKFDKLLALNYRSPHNISEVARFRHDSRPRSRWGQRSFSVARGRRNGSTPRQWICWFHYRHGNKAEKCEKNHPNDNRTTCIFFEERIPVYARKK